MASPFDGHAFTCPDCGRVQSLDDPQFPELNLDFPSIFFCKRDNGTCCCLKCMKLGDGQVNRYSPERAAHSLSLRLAMSKSVSPLVKDQIHRMMDSPERYEYWKKCQENERRFWEQVEAEGV